MTLRKIEHLTIIGLLAAALISILFAESYPGTILRSFAIQAMGFSFVLCVYFVVRKRWGPLLITNLTGLVFFFLLPSFYPVNANAEGSIIKIAHFNVFKFNPWRGSLIAAAKKSEADFISFQEINQKWADSIVDELCAEYPYYEVLPDNNGTQGLAVFSKFPLGGIDTIWLQGMPNMIGQVKLSETSIHFIASHLKAPTTYTNYKKRNRQLTDIADYMKTLKGPKMALGDYNAVPWDVTVVGFKNKTGLADSRKSLVPTYPSYFRVLQIPIDYIFHCSRISCVEFSSI